MAPAERGVEEKSGEGMNRRQGRGKKDGSLVPYLAFLEPSSGNGGRPWRWILDALLLLREVDALLLLGEVDALRSGSGRRR